VETDRIIASIAAGQHAAVSRRQLLDAGVSRSAIDRRVAGGRLVAVHSGVYRLAGHAQSGRQSLMAAVLAAGAGAAASHRGAAHLLEIPGLEPRAEITVARSRPSAIPTVLAHRGILGPPDITTRDGIPTTRPARTLIDLATVVTSTTLAVAVDDLLSRRLVTVDYLRRPLDAMGRQGRRGAGTLAELLADRRDGRPWATSVFERRLLAELRAAGLPMPRPQFVVILPGGRRAVLDYAYPDGLLALEADSYRHHSSRTDWGHDRVRNRWVTAIGWRILPVTWDDLAEPGEMIDAIRRGLKEMPRYAG
jgi:very-short-patch-repair endonuclease